MDKKILSKIIIKNELIDEDTIKEYFINEVLGEYSYVSSGIEDDIKEMVIEIFKEDGDYEYHAQNELAKELGTKSLKGVTLHSKEYRGVMEVVKKYERPDIIKYNEEYEEYEVDERSYDEKVLPIIIEVGNGYIKGGIKVELREYIKEIEERIEELKDKEEEEIDYYGYGIDDERFIKAVIVENDGEGGEKIISGSEYSEGYLPGNVDIGLEDVIELIKRYLKEGDNKGNTKLMKLFIKLSKEDGILEAKDIRGTKDKELDNILRELKILNENIRYETINLPEEGAYYWLVLIVKIGEQLSNNDKVTLERYVNILKGVV